MFGPKYHQSARVVITCCESTVEYCEVEMHTIMPRHATAVVREWKLGNAVLHQAQTP